MQARPGYRPVSANTGDLLEPSLLRMAYLLCCIVWALPLILWGFLGGFFGFCFLFFFGFGFFFVL